MTNKERKNAIKLALTRKEVAEKAYNEACAIRRQVYRNCADQWECAKANRRVEECEREMWDARNEYSALTKCKAWQNL
jgi:hypothetical protein